MGKAGAQTTRKRSLDADVTVEPGGSATLTTDVSIDEGRPVSRVDVLFCFDTTSSMEEEINAVKRRAEQIMSDIAGRDLEAAFAVAGFSDYPGRYSAYGYEEQYGADSDVPWQVYQAVTEDVASVRSALGEVPLKNGEDGPENYTRALYEMRHGDLGWREGALRVAVLFGDSIPHDDDFHEDAGEWGSYPSGSTGYDPGRDAEMYTADDLDFQTVVENLELPVLCVNSGDYDASMRYIAQRTGGAYFALEEAGQIPETVVDLVREETSTVTLTLDVELGYEDWFDWAPTSHEDVSAGSTRTFDLTVEPPGSAELGTFPVSVFVLADGSTIDEFEYTVAVKGSTVRPIASKKVSGSGPAWDRRKQVYRWFERTLAPGYWVNKGTDALRRFSEDFQTDVEEIPSQLPAEIAGELVDAGYYTDAVTFAKAMISLAEALKSWQVGTVMNTKGYTQVPASAKISPTDRIEKIRKLLADEKRDGAVEEIGVMDVEYKDADDAAERSIERCGPGGIEGHTSLLTFLCHWRKTVAGLTNPYESGWTTDYSPKETSRTLVIENLNLTEGYEESVSLTAPPKTHHVQWTTKTNGGWFNFGGDYEFTVELPRKPIGGPKSKTFDSEIETASLTAPGWSDRGLNPKNRVVSSGQEVTVTVEVVNPPITPVPIISEDDVDYVSVDVSLLHDYEWTETDAPAIGADVARQSWADSRRIALNHLDAAIAFFEAERDLLRSVDSVGVSAASPVDLHVETPDGGHLGPVYEDGAVGGTETNLDADYFYTGTDAIHEGLGLLNTGGQFDVSVRGRGQGTYDLEITRLRQRGNQVESEVVDAVEGVPASEGGQTFSLDLGGVGEDVSTDLAEVRRARRSGSSSLPVPLTPVTAVGGIVLVGGLVAAYRHFRDSGQEGADRPHTTAASPAPRAPRDDDGRPGSDRTGSRSHRPANRSDEVPGGDETGICPTCGAEVDPDRDVCPDCGARLGR
ncbi:MAG: hypothetical protein ABEJ40_08865 [Haloarculaceae archaeon]